MGTGIIWELGCCGNYSRLMGSIQFPLKLLGAFIAIYFNSTMFGRVMRVPRGEHGVTAVRRKVESTYGDFCIIRSVSSLRHSSAGFFDIQPPLQLLERLPGSCDA